MIPVPAGEEVAPKLARFLYFVGAGFLCTAVINKWKDWERKSTIQKQQQFNGQTLENQSNSTTPLSLGLICGFIIAWSPFPYKPVLRVSSI